MAASVAAIAIYRHQGRDRAVDYLQARIDALRPYLEQEIPGVAVPAIEAAFLSRDQLATVIREEAAGIRSGFDASWTTNGAEDEEMILIRAKVALADATRILVSDEPPPDIPGATVDEIPVALLPMRALIARDPEIVDVLLTHELAHVYQLMRLDARRLLTSCRSPADVLARSAVLEGHADYVARKIAQAMGRSGAWDRYQRTARGPSGWSDTAAFVYAEGLQFVEYVLGALGEQAGVARLFSEPVPTLGDISSPTAYLGGGRTATKDGFLLPMRQVFEQEVVTVSPLPPTLYAGAAGRDSRRDAVLAAEVLRARARHRPEWDGVELRVAVTATEEARDAMFSKLTTHLRDRDIERAAQGLYSGPVSCHPTSVLGADGLWFRRELEPVPMQAVEEHQLVMKWDRFVADIRITDPEDPDDGVVRLGAILVLVLEDDLPGCADIHGVLATEDATLLEALTRDERDPVRSVAAARLLSLHPDYAARVLEHTDSKVRSIAIHAFARDPAIDRDSRVRVLVSALADPEPRVAVAACRELSRISEVVAIPWEALRRLLVHGNRHVRRAGFQILGREQVARGRDTQPHQATQAECLEIVAAGLRDADVCIRASAAHLLRFINDRSLALAPCYRPAVADASWRVRYEALDSILLGRLPVEGLLRDLVEALGDDVPDVTRQAIRAVALYGRAAVPALPTLRSLESGPDATVGRTARAAIEAIERASRE